MIINDYQYPSDAFIGIDVWRAFLFKWNYLEDILGVHAIDKGRGHELLIGNNFASINVVVERARCPLCFKLSLLVPHSN